MNGILLIDKPESWTSFDVVNYIRNIIRKRIRNEHVARGFCMEIQNKEGVSSANRTESTVKRAMQAPDAVMRSKPDSAVSLTGGQGWRCKCRVKVGHTGTLDPAATGLLVICVGKYTKKVPEMIKHNKTYAVEVTLGRTSDTGDKEGNITEVNSNKPSNHKVNDVLGEYIGEILQTPPVFSAVKINGKRAYELARAGKEVKIQPRSVTINNISDIEYSYPILKFNADVGSGTYIRSLAEDVGKDLGTGAYMSNLRRLTVGEFKLEDAHNVSDITDEMLQKILHN